MRHINNGHCPLCHSKLTSAHPTLLKFFTSLQMGLPSIHVAWAFRGQVDQEDAFRRGTSPLHWPDSKHNKTPAEAIDCFELSGTGTARWDERWFTDNLAPAAKAAGLIWGGDFKKRKDFPHVEMAYGPQLV